VSDWEVRLDEWKGAVPFIMIKSITASDLDLQPDDILSVHAVNESVVTCLRTLIQFIQQQK
jgi:hypothetical protein